MLLHLLPPQKTRNFKNSLALFIYRKISPHLFTEFQKVESGGYEVFMATQEKAVLDTIYLTKVTPASLRLQNEEVLKKDKLVSLISLYPSWVKKKLEELV